jgi:hypothetical protein
MLLLTIILDTGNFSPTMGKTTEDDVQVCMQLMKLLGLLDDSPPTIPLSQHPWVMTQYETMMESKFDPQFWYLSDVDSILDYDYKQFSVSNRISVGMSTVLRNLSDGWNVDWSHVAAARRVEIFVVIAAYRPDESKSELKRQLYIHGLQSVVPVHKAQEIMRLLTEKFHLSCIPCTETMEILDSTFSRKKFAPIFLQLLNDLVE